MFRSLTGQGWWMWLENFQQLGISKYANHIKVFVDEHTNAPHHIPTQTHSSNILEMSTAFVWSFRSVVRLEQDLEDGPELSADSNGW